MTNLSVREGKGQAGTGLLPVVIGFVLVVGFFVAHQAWSSGFFTSSFGLLGTLLFYSALVLGSLTRSGFQLH